jgi:hypothetical protein
LHNVNLHKYRSSTDTLITRMMRSRDLGLEEHVTCMGVTKNAYNVVLVKRDRQKPHGRTRSR